MTRDHDLGAPVLKIVDGHSDDFFSIFNRMMLIKLNVDHIILFHFRNRMGGDEFGMEALGHIGQVLEDTLDVHHHGVTGAGDDGKLLLQECACRGNAVTL